MKKVYTEDQKKLILDRYWAGETIQNACIQVFIITFQMNFSLF